MTVDHSDIWKLYTPEVQAMMGVFALHWQLEQRLNDVCHEGQLGRSEHQLLLILAQPRRMGELARLTHKTPSAMTAAAAVLEQSNLIRRVRDPVDGRAWLLELTEEGRRRRAQLVDAASGIFYETSGLTREEAEILARLAQKIHNKAVQSGAVAPCEGDQT
ncbi:MarR family transcriptional regulator [Rhodobacteraceae bacterium R_SAG7]|nr:MarR family transcriptional regulator [Rhodobacteraceae bacterium R_SAG7]